MLDAKENCKGKSMQDYLFTSESVSEGHPDKVCDRISDAITDLYLSKDSNARTAIETIATTNRVIISGETGSNAVILPEDLTNTVRQTIREIGYEQKGFNWQNVRIDNLLHSQSSDIALGVDKALEAKEGAEDDAFSTGAGDQGMMFGYACDETPELMPITISLAHKLARRLTAKRKDGTLPYLRPDGKTQETVEFEDDRPVRVDTVVISSQHDPDVPMEKLREEIIREVVRPIIPENLLDENTRYYINPTGRFVVGGPQGDSGLTGRKIIVDTYGGYGKHGGGAFSGKDPTKVDRSAAYAARWVAKNIVAAGLARKCEIQLAYAIGVAHPVSIMVESFGTGAVSDEILAKAVERVFDLRPAAIIQTMGLRRPIYRQLAAYGHMGREDLAVAWEKTDRTDELMQAVKALQ